MKKTWFISDLHLDARQPQLIQLLDDFLANIASQAESLYILGDLFEFWVGDDLLKHPMGKPYLPVLDHLRKLSDAGVSLYFVQGNRDFLAQQTFAETIGAKLLPDLSTIDLYGKPTLIMHGDTLCTDDRGYQLMRRLFRMKLVQKLYLSLSIEKRTKKAGNVRQMTRNETSKKSQSILDVNQRSVELVMRDAGVQQLIHGHTHRPAEHHFELDGKPAKRIVLGDWHDKASYLVCDPAGMRLVF